jgi:integrase
MNCGITALSWAFREGHIPVDPTIGLVRFGGDGKKRGVLTSQEAAAVFGVEWKDKRSYIGNLLALTTGLRSGEILAIRQSDIEDRVVNVLHSWSCMDGLKSPKTGETRRVPLLPEVRGLLMELLVENPHGDIEDPFVFYGVLKDKPMDQKLLINGLRDACTKAGIDAAARGVVFHSWRHLYASRMLDKMTVEQVSRITGHKSRAVFDEYADHVEAENLDRMRDAAAETFGKVLPFNRKGA